jgi:hypothetical protein
MTCEACKGHQYKHIAFTTDATKPQSAILDGIRNQTGQPPAPRVEQASGLAQPLKEPAMRHRYRRKPDQAVTAIQLTLKFDGFDYQKWGDTQRAKVGDWLVDNEGDIYTVADDSFSRTYRLLSPGRWVKAAPVWAEQAAQAGAVATKEGRTHYEAGDWLVSNGEDGSDAYAISATKFEQMYEPEPGTVASSPGADSDKGG